MGLLAPTEVALSLKIAEMVQRPPPARVGGFVLANTWWLSQHIQVYLASRLEHSETCRLPAPAFSAEMPSGKVSRTSIDFVRPGAK